MGYLCGRHITIYDIKNQSQRFVIKEDEPNQVVDFTCSNENQSALFAVAYETIKGKVPECRIYSGTNKLVSKLNHSQLNDSYDICFMSFSKCEAYFTTLACSKSFNESVFTCWNVLTSSVKAIETLTGHVEYMAQSPMHSKGVLFTMANQLYELIYKRKKNEFFKRTNNQTELYVQLASSEDTLQFIHRNKRMDFIFYVFSESILFYAKNSFVQKISIAKESELSHSLGTITALTSFNNTLLVALSKDPTIYIYTLQKDLTFVYSDSIDLVDEGYYFIKIINFSISPDNSLISFSMLRSLGSSNENEGNSSVELGYILPNLLEAVNYSPKESLKILSNRSASGKSVIDIGLAENIELMAFITADKMIKIVELDNIEKELSTTVLIRQGLVMDIHPGGTQLAIGFKEGLKVFFVMECELKEVFESYNKQCYCVKYSTKGDRLAASSSSNIVIYDAYTFEQLQHIPAHAANIKTLFWRGRDAFIVSNCVNNNIFVWNTRTWDKDFEYFMPDKNSHITALDYDPELDLLLYSTDESILYMINDKGTLEVITYHLNPDVISYLLIDKTHKVLYAGTTTGCILVFLWPLMLLKCDIEYFRIPLHSASIRKIVRTYNDKELVTASDDCTIYINRIVFYDENLKVNVDEHKDTMHASEGDGDSFDEDTKTDINFIELIELNKNNEITEKLPKFQLKIQDFSYVSAETVRKLKNKIKDLDFNIQNIKNEIEDQQDIVLKHHKVDKTKNEEDNKIIIKKEKEELQILENVFSLQHKELDREEEQLKLEFKQKIAYLEQFKEQTLLELYRENDDINKQFVDRCDQTDEESMQLVELYSKKFADSETEYSERIQKIRSNYRIALDNLKIDQMKFTETLSQMEEEYRKELMSKQQMLQGKVIDEKKKAEDLKSMNLKLIKEAHKNREKNLYLENIIQEAQNQNKQLLDEIRSLKERADTINNELLQQEVNINKKETLLKQFRTKNNYLQSNKDVYDHLVDSLKEEYARLGEYMNGVNNNLKITHKRLIEEAESNKVLTIRKDKVLEELKLANERLLSTRLNYRNVVRNIENFLFELSHIIDNYELSEQEIDRAVKQLLSRTDIILQNKKKDTAVFNQRGSDEDEKDFDRLDSTQKSKQDKLVLPPVKNEVAKNDNFKDELDRLKEVYTTKLYETKSKFSKINHQRGKVLDDINNEGKSLINRCTTLKSKRMQLYQNLYDNKNKADAMAKELNVIKLKQYKEKLKASKPGEITLPKNPKKSPELPYHLYLQHKDGVKNENKSATANLNADAILKEAVAYCKRAKEGNI